MLKVSQDNRLLLKEMFRAGLLVLMIGSVLFLYLLQKVRSRNQGLEIARLSRERTVLIKKINSVEFEIEKMRRSGSPIGTE